MDLDSAATIYRQIQETSLNSMREDLIELAVRYARLRVDWLLADAEKQQSVGSDRSAAHNALIAYCDILARNMARAGEDASWRDRLGTDRKTIGDFACCLHCLLGLSAR